MDYELVEKAYSDGLTAAALLRNMTDDTEKKDILKQTDKYCKFLDDNFGVISEKGLTNTKTSLLAGELCIAIDMKLGTNGYAKDSLKGNDMIDTFINDLYSGCWIYSKIIYDYNEVKRNRKNTKAFIQNLDNFLKKTTHLDEYQKEDILKIIRS